jgi:Na+-translocating ferredoxin:NAD+ oxidoreductase RnfD subunit
MNSIRPANSTLQSAWMKLICLAPSIAFLIYHHGSSYSKTLLILSCLCLGFEWLALNIRKQKPSQLDLLDTSFYALVLSMCMPIDAPVMLLIFAVIITIVIAKHLFGGIGSLVFHPAMLGVALAALIKPNSFTELYLNCGSANVYLFFLLLLPGFFLIIKKYTQDEAGIAFLFGALILFGNSLLAIQYFPDLSPILPSFQSHFVYVAFLGLFVMNDNSFNGMLPRSRTLIGITAAVLLFITYAVSLQTLAFAYALLIVNMIVPWLDQHTIKQRTHETTTAP